jgi:hypothetical protein
MPTDSANNLYWLYLLLLLPTAVYYLVKVTEHFTPKKGVRDSGRTAQARTITLLRIDQSEPGRRPPIVLLIMTLIPACVLLIFGGCAIFAWITGNIEVHFDLLTILFLVAFIGLPLFVIIDNFVTQPKYYRLGRSHVAKEAIVTVAGHVDVVFDACYRALDSVQAVITILERPNLLKAKVRNSVMTVVTRQIEDSKVSVYVVSDSRWLTVKWDGGANQRNVDEFLRELGKQ